IGDPISSHAGIRDDDGGKSRGRGESDLEKEIVPWVWLVIAKGHDADEGAATGDDAPYSIAFAEAMLISRVADETESPGCKCLTNGTRARRVVRAPGAADVDVARRCGVRAFVARIEGANDRQRGAGVQLRARHVDPADAMHELIHV